MIRRSLKSLLWLWPLLLLAACDDSSGPETLCPGGDADAQLARLDEVYCGPMAEEARDEIGRASCRERV